MDSELVSIVMATYNGEKYLRQQLDSILSQSHDNLELIVVDDASVDGTLSILKEYAALDDRIHVFPTERNLGLVANFERGIKQAKGDFIALSDQDDLFRKEKIEFLLNALQDNPDSDLVVSDLSLIDDDGNEIVQSMWLYQGLKPNKGKPFRQLLYNNFATGCAIMFKRRLLEIALPFPPDCLVHDWWLAVVAASSRGGGICLVREPLTAYRQHRTNVIGARAVNNITAKEVISRFKIKPRGMSIAEARLDFRKPHIARLDGYLQRDCWSTRERKVVKETKMLFENYLTDVHSSFLSRISKIPQRLRYAATTGRVSPCISVLIATIWPYR